MRVDLVAFELPHPPAGDLTDRHRIEKVQFLAAALCGCDEVGVFQDRKVFRDGLPRHGQLSLGKAGAQLVQRLAAVGAEPVEQGAAAVVGQGPEHQIHTF